MEKHIMATPNVDEIWADYNPDGSVHEPNKVDVRRWGRFLEAIATASGMKTYPNKAAMDADLTQPDGKPALLWSDPTPANNFPTVWVWNDAGNVWIAGTDRIQSLKDTVDLMHNVMRRVVVLGGEGIIDRLGLLGGGAGQIYLPRNILIDMPGQAATNITVANANSTEKPGWCKLAIPVGPPLPRSFLYLDRADNTFKIIAATGGEFTLPTTAADMIVPIIDLPTPGASGWWSPYKFRELSPLSALSAFVTTFPMVHDRAANKLLIPSFTVRAEGTLYTHTVAASQRYEEFALASAGNAAITYWYKFATNTVEITIGGGTPFQVDPTLGIVIGWSWANEFYSPWPHIGMMSEALGKNDFACGKGDSLLLSPSVWEGEITNLGMVNVADATLIGLGFTRALRTTNAAATWPYIGDRIADNRAGKTFFARLWLEATVDNDFGAARVVRLLKADGIGQSIQFILEKTLSPRAAIYSVIAQMPDWRLNTPASGEYVFVQVGASQPGGTNEVRIAGAQFAFGQNAQWIERDDFPTTPANGIRITNLEAATAETDPVPSILYGEDLWLITGRKQSLHIDNIFEKRTERKGVLTTLFAPNPTVGSSSAKPYEQTLEAGSFVIDPVEVGNVANIWTHRYSDTSGGAALGRSYRSADITVHKASASGTGTVRVMGIGDSIMSSALVDYIRTILAARGMTVTMSGTVGTAPLGNEGRPGSTFTDHIHARTDWLTPVSNWATYLAASDATKQTLDPFTRASTGGDPAGAIYNTRIFDFSYYLTNTGITPPTHVFINLGTNDIAAYAAVAAADWINKALTIMVPSILAAVPTAKIAIGLPTLPRSAIADARWNASYGLALRALLKYKRTLANSLVKMIPIWAHINQVTSFGGSEVVVSTDPDTGMVTLDNGDLLHPSVSGRRQYAEVVAAWVANTFDGT
jgi:lysophospholipase L1-like esterase